MPRPRQRARTSRSLLQGPRPPKGQLPLERQQMWAGSDDDDDDDGRLIGGWAKLHRGPCANEVLVPAATPSPEQRLDIEGKRPTHRAQLVQMLLAHGCLRGLVVWPTRCSNAFARLPPPSICSLIQDEVSNRTLLRSCLTNWILNLI